MKRIIFVGVHNKPGKEPLDSSTTSGKRVDQIIKGLKGCACVKTNLFEMDRQPEEKEEANRLLNEWILKYKPAVSDVVVLLGSQVQYSFPKIAVKVVRLAHPSLQYSHVSPADYIKNAVKLIKKAL